MITNYTWDDMKWDVRTIVDQIKKNGVNYDYVCGIGRGGLIPAVWLSHKLMAPLITLRCQKRNNEKLSYYDCSDEVQEILSDPKNKVLMVDDIMDSGETADLIENEVYEKFDWACLIYNKSQPHPCKYYGTMIDREKDKEWVNFWWERIE